MKRLSKRSGEKTLFSIWYVQENEKDTKSVKREERTIYIAKYEEGVMKVPYIIYDALLK